MSLIPYDATNHKSGAIYIEAATCIDLERKTYDWSKKVKFALGPADLNTILEAAALQPDQRKDLKLIHVPAAEQKSATPRSKSLQLRPGKDNYVGTWLANFNDQITGNQVSCPISHGEFIQLVELIKANLSYIYGWQPLVNRENADD